MPRSAAPASTYVATSEGRMVTSPTSSKSSLRSFARTSRVSTPSASSRSRVSRNIAPRGTASFKPLRPDPPIIVDASSLRAVIRGGEAPRESVDPASGRSQPLPAPLADQRDVQPLDVERPARGGEGAAVAAEQVVVAAAAAQRGPERGVVDLEHPARVVRERAR